MAEKQEFVPPEESQNMASKNAVGPTISQIKDPNKMHRYVLENSLRVNEHQRALMQEIDELPRGVMAGSQDEAQFLAFLVELIGAKKVLEVGVFRGSTALTVALALPADGKVIGLDISEEFVATGKKYWEKAGVSEKIDLRIGAAAEEMEKLLAEGHAGTFDLVFIDADKTSYDAYYELGLKLLRQGGVVAVDNVLWHGRILQEESEFDADTKAIADINKKLHADERVSMVMLEIADGLTLCRKR